LGNLRLSAQSTATRINSKTTTTTQTVDPNDLRLDGAIADARDFNVTAPSPYDTAAGLPDLLTAGETVRDKPVYGLTGTNSVLNQLDSGTFLSSALDGTITFSFFTAKHAVGLNNNPGLGEGKGYAPFTEAQKAAARVAIHNWDDIIAPEYQEVQPGPGVSSWAKNEADIWMANTVTGPAQAWAYYPGSDQPFKRVSSDVWIADPRANGSNGQLDPGFYGLQTLNHELGHAIGLSHPGDYNFGDDNDGDGVPDPITYEGDAFYAQDSHQYTIMSYFDSFELGNNQVDFNFMRFVYPSTPMVHDIFVAQYKYGAEMNTRTGDTTYGFNSTGDVWNDAMKFDPGEMATIFSIWDADGHDTLDLSGYYTPSIIDLREGGYSSAGGWGSYRADLAGTDPSALTKEAYLAIINPYNAAEGFGARTAAYDLYFGGRAGANEGIAWSEIMGNDYLMENNIGIAYGAIIEDAKGGYGNDRINGNQAENHFWGNAGSDTFVIADYSGVITRPTATGGSVDVTIDDESVDSIMDFQTGVDKIDLTELGVTWADLSVSGDTWTVERGDDDLSFIVLGSTAVQADFIF